MTSKHVAPDLSEIHSQLPATLTFPVESAADLKSKLPKGRYTFRNQPVNRIKAIERIPADLFPIKSLEDFDQKISRLIAARDASTPKPQH